MAANISSLVLNANEGEITFEASGEYWIWKATAETTNGRYDQAVTVTLRKLRPPVGVDLGTAGVRRRRVRSAR